MNVLVMIKKKKKKKVTHPTDWRERITMRILRIHAWKSGNHKEEKYKVSMLVERQSKFRKQGYPNVQYTVFNFEKQSKTKKRKHSEPRMPRGVHATQIVRALGRANQFQGRRLVTVEMGDFLEIDQHFVDTLAHQRGKVRFHDGGRVRAVRWRGGIGRGQLDGLAEGQTHAHFLAEDHPIRQLVPVDGLDDCLQKKDTNLQWEQRPSVDWLIDWLHISSKSRLECRPDF